MDWGVTIDKVENGYLINYNSEDPNYTTSVIEIQSDTLKDEQKALQHLFYSLREYFGVYNNKHSNQYLDINVSGDED